MENMKLCQSCGMPMGDSDEMYATNADGSKNPDYCVYCMKDGAFTSETSMDEMIEICVPYMVSGNEEMTEAAARKMMKESFPTLKRWQTA